MYQLGGVATRRNRWIVRTKNIPSVAYTEASSLSSSASLPAVRHAENDGQRRNILRSPRSFHIYFQVFNAFISPVKLTFSRILLVYSSDRVFESFR